MVRELRVSPLVRGRRSPRLQEDDRREMDDDRAAFGTSVEGTSSLHVCAVVMIPHVRIARDISHSTPPSHARIVLSAGCSTRPPTSGVPIAGATPCQYCVFRVDRASNFHCMYMQRTLIGASLCRAAVASCI